MNAIQIEGIEVHQRPWGLSTKHESFQQDWKRLKELEAQGIAHRVGWGIAYEVGKVTFMHLERYDTDPKTYVQTSVNWFAVIPGKGHITNHEPPTPVWDPREQSGDWDPDELN